MSFINTRQQGNKKDFTHPKSNLNRGNNKKWANNGNSPNRNAAGGGPRATEPVTVEDPEVMRHMHDRMLFLLAHLTGSVVQVTTKNGVKYEGIFHGASTEGGDIGVALKYPQKTYDPEQPGNTADQPKKINKQSLLILGKDLVEITCADTDLTIGEATAGDHKDSFKTDTDISGRTEIKERELHKWSPETIEAEDDFGALEGEGQAKGSGGLGANGGATGGTWDQFAANEKLFGVKTDFDEEIYTTRLDRSAPDFKDRERWAIEKANEIQRSGAINTHVLEERGVMVDDLDEEDRYGAVIRDPSKYTPPALRKQQSSTKEEHSRTEKPEVVKNMSPLHKLMTGNLPKADGAAPSPISNLPTVRAADAATAGTGAGANATSNNNTNNKKVTDDGIEHEVADSFRQFAIKEKGKLYAKKQALQKKDKEDRLAELKQFHKSFKLNLPVPPDLMPLLSKNRKSASSAASNKSAFDQSAAGSVSKDMSASTDSANTSSPTVPAKTEAAKEKKSENNLKSCTTEKTKQPTGRTEGKEQSLGMSATSAITTIIAAVPAVSSPEDKVAHVVDGSNVGLVVSTTTTSDTKSLKTSFKFNVKATEFKPNPSAAVFIPGAKIGPSAGEGSPFFAGRQLKKGTDVEHLTLAEAFKPPFSKENEPVTPSSVGPTWPFGTKQYKLQFNQYSPYEDDMYGYAQPGFPYGFPQYRFQPQYVQGISPMPVQQGAHPFMSPQFVHNMPIGAAPMPPHGGAPPPPGVAYSPQMANVSPHGSPFPQGFPSPQRSPIAHHGVPPHQIYQYQGGPPMMIRYPEGMPPPNTTPGGPSMIRPIVDPGHLQQPQHYPPQHASHHNHQDAGAPQSVVSADTDQGS